MKKEINTELPYVTKAQAIKLKKAGFNYPTNGWYTSYPVAKDCRIPHPQLFDYNDKLFKKENEERYSAPPIALALQWLRDKKKLFLKIDWASWLSNKKDSKLWWFEVENLSRLPFSIQSEEENFSSYEKAESAGLDFLLDYVLKKKK